MAQPGGRGVFLDDEGDAEHYVVEFENAIFCCAADDGRADPGLPVPITRRHDAT